MFQLTSDLLLGRLLVIALGIPIHEWAHCWMASVLGDETPEAQGRLTLNPLVHLDPIGTLLILFTGFGWGRAAQVNPLRMWRVRNPRVGMALSALAGPLSNIIQAMILAIPFRLGLIPLGVIGEPAFLTQVLITAIAVNVGLAAFNMIPVPPLDGSRVLAGIVPSGVADIIENMEPYAPLLLVMVLFILPQMGFDLVGRLVYPLQVFILRALFFW